MQTKKLEFISFMGNLKALTASWAPDLTALQRKITKLSFVIIVDPLVLTKENVHAAEISTDEVQRSVSAVILFKYCSHRQNRV